MTKLTTKCCKVALSLILLNLFTMSYASSSYCGGGVPGGSDHKYCVAVQNNSSFPISIKVTDDHCTDNFAPSWNAGPIAAGGIWNNYTGYNQAGSSCVESSYMDLVFYNANTKAWVAQTTLTYHSSSDSISISNTIGTLGWIGGGYSTLYVGSPSKSTATSKK